MIQSKSLAVWPIAASVAAIVILCWLRAKPRAVTQRDLRVRQIGFRPVRDNDMKLRRVIDSATALLRPR